MTELDSYTGDPYVAEYESKIPGINKPRQSFYRDREALRAAKQYWVSPVAEGWRIHRVGCPAELFPVLPSQEGAVRGMDWLVRNDASMEIALGWLVKHELDPFFNLLDKLMEAING